MLFSLIKLPKTSSYLLIGQAMLHRKLGKEPPFGNVSLPAAPCSALECSSRGSGHGASSDGGQSELEPRVARVVRKLASKKWVVLYESLKTMFTLQAEMVARGVVCEAFAVLKENESADLEGLRRFVAAWKAYKDWCEEVR